MTITAKHVKELRERSDGAGMMDCKKALVAANGDMELALQNLRKAGIAKASKKAGRIAADGTVVIKLNENNKLAVIIEVNCETDFVAKDTNFTQFAEQAAETALAANCDSLEQIAELTVDGASIEETRKELVAKLGENIQIRRLQLVKTTDGVISTYRHGTRIGVVVSMAGGNSDLAKDITMHVAASNPQAISPDDVPDVTVNKEREIFSAQAKDSGKPADIVEKMVEGRIKKFLKEVSLLEQPFVKDPSQTVGQLLKANNAKIEQFVRYEVGEGIEKQTEDFASEVMAQIKGDT